MARAKRTKRHKPRRIGSLARDIIGYPTQRDFPTATPRKGVTATSGLVYRTSVVWVGTLASEITDSYESRLIKVVSDRVRKHLDAGGMVSVKFHTLFARAPSVVETPEGEILEIVQYHDEDFPDVSDEWEWRSRYSGPVTHSIGNVRNHLRDMFTRAREESDDASFVFIDSIEITKWNA